MISTRDNDHINVEVARTDQHVTMAWKNGLGTTSEIAIRPRGAKFTDVFDWRLSLSELEASCSFSVFPGYNATILLLPGPIVDEYNLRSNRTSLASIQHNNEESTRPLKPLVPYNYDAAFPTSCNVETAPLYHLTLLTNASKFDAKVAVETISAKGKHGHTHDGRAKNPAEHDWSEDDEADGAANGTTRRVLLAETTFVYLVRGVLKVEVEDAPPRRLSQGETLIVERKDTEAPLNLRFSPVGSGNDGNVPGDVNGNHDDATLVLIEIARQMDPSLYKSPSVARAPRRKGSIIVFDDQPLQYLPAAFESRGSISGDSPADANTLPVKQWDSVQLYRPPNLSSRYANESHVPPPVIKDSLKLDDFPRGQISTAWINIMKQGLGEWIRVPVIIARGSEDGPVVGITAVVHGNELNGVPCIHRVVTDIDVHVLRGTLVAVPCVNTPGYLKYTREFSDGKDLNRQFPGVADGTASQVFVYNLMSRIVDTFDYLIDLHTASFGRVNSYYVRADMNDPVTAQLARLQQPQIILHNSGQDGTMRSACMAKGIRAITVEIGNPSIFQNQFVAWSYSGVMRILNYLDMFPLDEVGPLPPSPATTLCSRGFWIYTKTGGVLEVYPSVNTLIRKGDLIARIKNIFGNIVDEIYSPSTGIKTVGRSSNPVAMAGDRVLHLGILKKEGEVLPAAAKENY
ncbi:hypothetical protein DFJ74DRAFT_773549 [Hyaloraphidium curvatum]|nr:hypothetical protein DFJ74DRAFT_773549 [Hyaloraphidium curvatum]